MTALHYLVAVGSGNASKIRPSIRRTLQNPCRIVSTALDVSSKGRLAEKDLEIGIKPKNRAK